MFQKLVINEISIVTSFLEYEIYFIISKKLEMRKKLISYHYQCEMVKLNITDLYKFIILIY